MNGRHVKVTLEGVGQCDPDGQIIRLRCGTNAGPLVLISKAWPGVVVEDVTPPRTWTDGDVVQSVETGRAYVRGHLSWAESDDRGTSLDVESGALRVLRYQAGE